MLIFNFQDNFSPSFVVELRWFVQWPVSFLNLTLIYNLNNTMGWRVLLIPDYLLSFYCLYYRQYNVGWAGLSYMVVKFSLVS